MIVEDIFAQKVIVFFYQNLLGCKTWHILTGVHSNRLKDEKRDFKVIKTYYSYSFRKKIKKTSF